MQVINIEKKQDSKRRSVYDITMGAEVILSHGAAIEGEEEIEEWFKIVDEWAGEAGDKLTALRVVKRMAMKRVERWKVEIENFKKAIERDTRTVSLMDTMALSLVESHRELTGKSKYSTDDGGWVGVRTYKSEKVNVVDELALPEEFVEVSRRPMKSVIKEALRNGREVPGVELEHSERIGVQWSKL